MRDIRVFVSSPGDAENERKRVVRVMERLNAAFAGVAAFKPVLWEERFYSAHDGFQPQIERSAECDIVIAILRGRLGTPLPPDFMQALPKDEHLPDGEVYPSGTAYEILSAIAARRRGASLPDIFVFRYPHSPLVGLDDLNRADIEAQWHKLKSFADGMFGSAQQHFKAAYQPFSSTDDFETKAEGALRQWLSENVLKDRAVVWPVAVKGSPFRGLQPFGAKHAEVFFGRDGDRIRALDRLKDAAEAGFPFLAVVGPSGAGKSSFARAGILPWLVKPGAVTGVGVWRTALMRPSDHPDGAIAALARHLFDAEKDIPEAESGRPVALPELASGDSATPQALAGLLSLFARGRFERPEDLESAGHAAMAPIEKALRSVGEAEREKWGSESHAPARLLLVIDQFDDLFAPGVDEAACAAFARLLDRMARSGLVWIVVTLRAELYEAFLKSPLARLASPDISGAAQRLQLTFDLLPPGLSEMAEVVRGPARAAGLDWETDPDAMERLDERLLRDIDQPDLLPLVQFVLDRLYEQRVVKDGAVMLTFKAYRTLGTLDGAIDTAAETALSSLGPAEKAALPRLLRTLVTYTRAAHGTGKSAIALVVAPRKSVAHDEASTRLVEALTQARILISGQNQDKVPTIALAHQRVVEAWRSAQNIVSDSESLLRVRDEVENQRHRWEAGKRRGELLLARGLPLAEARDMAALYGTELPPATLAFIAASRRRANRAQAVVLGAAIAFALVAIGAGVAAKLAVDQRAVANRNFDAARTTVDSLIVNIAGGLRNVEGMRVETIRKILETVQRTVDQLQAAAPDDPRLQLSRSEMWGSFAQTYLAANLQSDALNASKQGLEIARKIAAQDPNNPQFRNNLFKRLFDHCVMQLRLNAAYRGTVDFCQESLDMARKIAALYPNALEPKINVSLGLDMRGEAKRGQKDLAGALADLQESLDMARKLAAADTDDAQLKRNLAIILNDIADTKKQAGDLAGVLAAYKGSVDVFRQLAEQAPGDTEAARTLWIGLTQLGDTELQLGDLTNALAAYQERLDINRKLAALDPSNAVVQHTVADVLVKIGDLKQRLGDLSAARLDYQESLSVDEKQPANNPSKNLNILTATEKLAALAMKTGDYSGAVAVLERRLNAARDMFANDSDPESRSTITKYSVMISLLLLGDAKLQAGDKAGAFAAARENLDFARGFAAQDAGNAKAQGDVSEALDMLGDLNERAGDLTAALAAYQESLQIRRTLAEQAPGDVQAQQGLTNTLKHVGDAKRRAGDPAGALAAFRERLDIAHKLAKVQANSEVRGIVAQMLGDGADSALHAKDYAEALSLSDEAIAIAPDQLWLYVNRAHALMFLGRTGEARALYLKHRGEDVGEKSWDSDVLGDFASLRKDGLNDPLMDEIEKLFAGKT